MSEMPDFTTVVALDAEHLLEFGAAWQTWLKFRPEILRQPLLLLCDEAASANWGHGTPPVSYWMKLLEFVADDHPNSKMKFWNQPLDRPQRERALTALTFAANDVETPWYLKLDTDAIATRYGPWIDPKWFDDGPAYVTSAWPYSKPADVIERLDNWGDCMPGLRDYPRLNLPFDPNSSLIRHRRIISYVFFGRTEWTQKMTELMGNRLPVPSQDTVLWYLAKRRHEFTRTVKMKKYGWQHVSGLRRIRKVTRKALRARREMGD